MQKLSITLLGILLSFTVGAKNLLILPNNSDTTQKHCVKYEKPEIGIRAGIGYMMAHHSQMMYLIQGHCKSYELYAEYTGNYKPWHHAYRKPVLGIAAHLTDFGNQTQMGYAITAIPYVKFHLIKRKKFGLHSRLGTGLAYLTKSFDRLENNKNSAIASPYNATLSINFEPEWHFSKFDLGLGLSFIHFSNGAWKMPNLGFNVPEISLSIGRIAATKSRSIETTKIKQPLFKKNSFECTGILGVKEIMPSNGPKYLVANIQGQYRRQFSEKSNLLFFADINYNKAYLRAYENWYKTTAKESDAIRAGGGIGYGMSLGRLLLFVHNGFYVLDKLDSDTFMYHRIGSKYYFDTNLVFNFSLKTHFAKADVVEIGMGYRF